MTDTLTNIFNDTINSANNNDTDDTTAIIKADEDLSFVDLELSSELLDALSASGYDQPTPIQAQAIPPALAGRDLLLSAQTGSGKTAAFVLPVLDKIIRDKSSNKVVHTVILTPTRELANQVSDSVRRYSAKTRNIFSVPLVGGAPYGGQIRALKKGVQIIIATPGRFIDHMKSERIDLSDLDILILDEADRMLDMGFADDIEKIMSSSPKSRQTIMSSATWDGPVGKIAESFTNNPERIAIKVESAHIEETVYYCDDFNHKNNLLDSLLNDPEVNQAIIFAATKRSCETLSKSLVEKGHKARYLHGDLPQNKRTRIINDVKAGKVDVLVATDVAARGIDVSGISHVFNYDLPRQVEDYVHRIGRSGRAGRTGIAINLCSIDDRPQLNAINRYLKRTMKVAEVEGLEPKKNTQELRIAPAGKRGRGGRNNGSRNRNHGGGGNGRGRSNHNNSNSRNSNNGNNNHGGYARSADSKKTAGEKRGGYQGKSSEQKGSRNSRNSGNNQSQGKSYYSGKPTKTVSRSGHGGQRRSNNV